MKKFLIAIMAVFSLFASLKCSGQTNGNFKTLTADSIKPRQSSGLVLKNIDKVYVTSPVIDSTLRNWVKKIAKENGVDSTKLSEFIPWTDTLLAGKMYSKYFINNALLQKINYSDTLESGKIVSKIWYYNHLPGIDTTGEFVNRTIYINSPTDPTTPGNDLTGNGTISQPYASLTKVFSTIREKINADITIKMGSGTFNFTTQHFSTMSAKFYGVGNLILDGDTNVMVNLTGTTYTNDTLDVFKIKVKPPTGTIIPIGAQAYRFNFLQYSTNTFIPVWRNQATQVDSSFSVSIANTSITGSLNKFVSLGTILDVNNIPQRFANCRVNIVFKNLRIRNINTLTLWSSYIQFNTCRLTGYAFNAGYGLYLDNRSYAFIRNSIVEKIGSAFFVGYNSYLDVRNSIADGDGFNAATFYIRGSTVYTSKSIFDGGDIFQMNSGDLSFDQLKIGTYFTNNVFSPSLSNRFDLTTTGTNPKIIFEGSRTAIALFAISGVTNVTNNLNATIDYSYIRSYNPLNFKPYATGTRITKFVQPEQNFSWYIKNYDFPEIESKLTANILNNSTDSISVGNKTYNRTIEIDYSITRGTSFRSGTVKILNTGTTLFFDPGTYFENSDCGITFNGAYYSGTSNTIKLKWTSTNTGTSAVIKFDAKRQNY